MTFKVDERIRETSTTQGVGTYTMAGAPTGFFPASSIGANNYMPYWATDGLNSEVGIGRYLAGPDRLERTHILRSSNANAAVNWGAGTRTIRCHLPAWLALPRTLSKAVGGGAATTVLSILEQRATYIELTGVLTGARVIEVDDTPGIKIVKNSTTGAFGTTLRVTGQTGVVVPQGRLAVLCCDGVDIRGASGIPGASSEFDAGTKAIFQQTAAPVGWTKDTTHDNKALRITTGTVGSGGATGFTSVFGAGKSSSGHTLATGEIPAHGHAYIRPFPGALQYRTDATSGITDTAQTTDNAGGGGSHSHGLSLDLHYVDVITATRN